MKLRKILLSALVLCIAITFYSCSDNSTNNKPIITTDPPVISYLETTIGQVRQEIGIVGDLFRDVQGTSYVTFNGLKATDYTFWTNKKIIVKVPEGATTGQIIVYVDGKASNAVDFTVQQSVPIVDCVEIQPGEFVMGSDDAWAGFWDGPAHNVKITYKFFMTKYEINQKIYKRIMGSEPSKYRYYENYPVEQVSWNRAIEFCNELSKWERYDTCYTVNKDGTVTCNFNANGYRLPTEAEWEYACRAGTTGKFGGDIIDIAVINDNWGFQHPAEVGSMQPNAWGLYDMHGNVEEWCWDLFDAGYYDARPDPDIDPTGPIDQASNPERIVRGGSFQDGQNNCTSVKRDGRGPDNGNYNRGFRVVRKNKL